MDFNKENINMVDAKKAKRLLLQPVSVMQWNGSILVSMHIQLRTLERTSFSSRECRHSTNVDFRSISHCVLLRPIGGVVFGIIGDKYGRKVVLTSTIILMAFSTLTIGLLPSYDQIGLWAPILLLLARVLQGFSTGGEYAGAMTYVAESSPDKRRNSLGSGLEIGTLSGYIAASIMIALLTFFLTDEQMASFGWRIPFLLGLFLGLFGLYLRRKLEESPVFENDVATQPERDNINFYKSSDFITKIYLCVL